MKALLEIDFETPALARKALGIIKAKEFSDKATLSLSVKGSVLRAEVGGKGFAALRARVTSFLRDAKVVFDAISLVESKKGRRK
ncbi:MAG: KEOPS complex subunit Pcc1 [Candidatus Micrarchaeota archaeon]